MKKGVIFDMDGVLINSEQPYFERRMRFLREHSVTPYSKDMRDYIGLDSRQIWQKMIPTNPVLRERLSRLYDEYRQANPISFPSALNKGVYETLEELKRRQLKVAIASSSYRKDIRKMMEDCGLLDLIDYYVSGEDCIRTKPDPEIYHTAVRALGLTSRDCLAVEDSPTGIRAAKAAGLYTVALKQQDYQPDQREADTVIHEIRQIKELVRQ